MVQVFCTEYFTCFFSFFRYSRVSLIPTSTPYGYFIFFFVFHFEEGGGPLSGFLGVVGIQRKEA